MIHVDSTNGVAPTATLLSARGGRPIKFTPERLQQIRNLVERGTHRADIAKMLDVTLGSLQVTCSKAGISLRRIKAQQPPSVSSLQPIELVERRPPRLAPVTATPVAPVSIALTLRYQGRERTAAVPLAADDLTRLVLEAEMRGMSLGELIGAILVAVAAKDLFQVVRP